MAFGLEIELSLWVFVLLILAGFAAGYIDAVAGGGGMIQALALLMAGIAPINILATNKMVSVSGTVTAVIKYAYSKVINWHLVKVCLLPCLIASAIGSQLVIYFSDTVIIWLIILCIPIALLVMFVPHDSHSDASKVPSDKKAILSLSPIAFYDGLIGPGTGTYMAIVGNKFLNMRYLPATGLAKPLNLATNVGALIVFILAGKVLWALALPMAVASMIGAYIGSHSAISRGDTFIRKVMLIMLIAMLVINLIKLIY